jgi:hypothetical protein
MAGHSNLQEKFLAATNYCVKLDSYFRDYEQILGIYRGQKPTIVEIGVLDGGSLQMWRDYFGADARIIGIEKNPNALKVAKLGFEIYTADQEQVSELRDVFQQIGNVDVVIDDGGHTSRGQIVTCLVAMEFIQDKGIIVIEDTHSSYAADFGMPHKYSFGNWANQVNKLLDLSYLINRDLLVITNLKKINTELKEFAENIIEVRKFRSMTVFCVQKGLSRPSIIDNMKRGLNSTDMRWGNQGTLFKAISKLENLTAWHFTSAGATNPKFQFLNVWVMGRRKHAIQRILKPLNLFAKKMQFSFLQSKNYLLREFFFNIKPRS